MRSVGEVVARRVHGQSAPRGRAGAISALVTSALVASALAGSPRTARAADGSAPPADTRGAYVPVSRPAYATSGLALLAGVGAPYGWVGASATYFVRPSRAPLFLAPYVSGGYVSGDTIGVFAYAFGVTGVFGRRHRIVVHAGGGVEVAEVLRLHGIAVDARAVLGVDAGVGYEYVAASGFTLRVEPLGAGLALGPRVSPQDRAVAYSPSLAIGLKLW